MPRMRRKNGRTQRPEDGDTPVLFPKKDKKAAPRKIARGCPSADLPRPNVN